MPLTVGISSPPEGAALNGAQPGFPITVTGGASGLNVLLPATVVVEVDGRRFPAQPVGATGWTCQVRVYSAGQKRIVAKGSARGFNPKTEEPGPMVHDDSSPRTVTVAFAANRPDLTIVAPTAGPLDLPDTGRSLLVRAETRNGFGRRVLRWEFEGRTSNFASASPTSSGANLRWESTLTLSPLPLGRRTVTVRCRDDGGNETTRSVALEARDVTSPTVEVLEPRANQTFVKGPGPLSLPVRGTALDRQSGLASVELSLNGVEPFRPASTQDTFAHWQSSVSVAEFGSATVFVRGTDRAGRVSQQQIAIRVINEYRPRDLAERLDARAYLEALLAFAHEHVTVGGARLSTALLQETFHQSFGRLSQPLPDFGAAGDHPINQLRAVVGVLRRFLPTPPPAPLVAGYRQSAYAALLAGIGTSVVELRLLRGAEPATRRAVAERLGITLGGTTPDELDGLTLDPAGLTEARLELLFGLRDTAVDRDPLRPLGKPLVLNWRETRQADVWAEQDRRPDAPVIVDPDVIGPADLAVPAGPAAALLTARRQEVDGIAAALDAVRREHDAPRAAIDALLADTLPGTDLAALDIRRRSGEDIGPTLRELFLARDAFDQLLRAARLADTGPLTETEWVEVRDILTQVRKERRYAAWRAEENAITLSPDHFRLADEAPPLPRWRASTQARGQWQRRVRTRIAERRSLHDGFEAMLAIAEEIALPELRDALVAGARGPVFGDDPGERLTERLQIDVKTGGTLRITPILQAIETLQTVLFSLRTGRLPSAHPAAGWIVDETRFDLGWQWLGSHESWRSAMLVFLYPENVLTPSAWSHPTAGFTALLVDLRRRPLVTSTVARQAAAVYLNSLTTAQGLALGHFELREPRSPTDFQRLRDLSRRLLEDRTNPAWVVETLFLVPIQLALRLAESGEFLAALDWFQAVYAYNFPPAEREIYHGLVLERIQASDPTPSTNWLNALNPHTIAPGRPNPYTRFTLLNLARTCLEFGDAEFTRDTIESLGHARALNVTARELLASSELVPVPNPDPAAATEFPNPAATALQVRADTQLGKLRQGRNIAGLRRSVLLARPTGDTGLAPLPPRMPTPYPYKVLVERTKQLVALSQQVEAEYLGALEKFDQAAFRRFEANQGVDLALAGVTLQDLRVREAGRGVVLAELQKDRADFLAGEYQQMIDAGLNEHEHAMLRGYRDVRDLRDLVTGLDAAVEIARAAAEASSWWNAVTTFGVAQVGTGVVIGGLAARAVATGFLNAAEAQLQADTFWASHERRVEEWRLNQGLAQHDGLIAAQQIVQAQDQLAIAGQERLIAQMTAEQAQATVEFLDRQFTNAELYEWMSALLVGVYRYFLLTATAMARLAQDQLAFERQEPASNFIRVDYWQPPAELAGPSGSAPDRRGLTGSARLLQDLYQLDQYAFQTDRRRLNLTQTLSLAQRASLEFQLFRQTGLLRFATPMQWFDDDFPGHYLRLIKRVRVSVVGLIPPTHGVRATLRAIGISRVVTVDTDGAFREVVIRRDPELIAFSAPVMAGGVFELDTQPEMLLPFEAMGVDTAWELHLPRAANPFDFASIADVLLTVEYTALHSDDYRGQVLQRPGATTRYGDRPLSLRRDFPDQWYDLHNPTEPDGSRGVRLTLEAADFPSILEQPTTEQIVLFLDTGGAEVPPTPVVLRHGGAGGEAQSIQGVVSTRRGNAPNWSAIGGSSPLGEWELELPAALVDDGSLEDVVLVIGYSGRIPAWPS
jgi:hypothetical protein